MTTETAIQIQVSRHQQTLVDTSRAEQSRADSDLDLGLGQLTLVDTDYNDYRDSDLDLGQQTLVDRQ